MEKIEVLEEAGARIPAGKKLNVMEYCKRKISMYAGEDTRAQLVLDKSLMNPLIDRFGKDVRVVREGEDNARAFVPITNSGPFFGWLTQFGDKIRIDEPESLKREYLDFLKKIQKQYR